MRILTNKYDLPETLVNAVKNDSYVSGGDISVTALIDSPRIRILKRKYDYEEDVSEVLYALLGTAMHHIIERANDRDFKRNSMIISSMCIKDAAKNLADEVKKKQMEAAAEYILKLSEVLFPQKESSYIYEKTLFVEMATNGVVKVIKGTFDLYNKLLKILYDYKVCSVYQWIYPEFRKKWIAQVNVYAKMMQDNGYDVKEIRIVAFFRDWSESKAMSSKDYPQRQIMEIPVPLKSNEEITAYMQKRLDIHFAPEETGIIPMCTGTERWARAGQWAVMEQGKKRAVKVFDVEQLASDFFMENIHKLNKPFIQHRPGESVRCSKFCAVAKYCDQRQAEVEEQKKLSNNQ